MVSEHQKDARGRSSVKAGSDSMADCPTTICNFPLVAGVAMVALQLFCADDIRNLRPEDAGAGLHQKISQKMAHLEG